MLLSAAATLLASLLATVTCAPPSEATEGIRFTPLQTNGAAKPAAPAAALPITYRYNGKVLTSAVNLYYIFYGTFTATQKQILLDFGNGITNTPWWGLSKKYYYQKNSTGGKTYVSKVNGVVKSIDDAYSAGKSLTNTQIKALIQGYITTGRLAEDPNGLYFFLHSGDVGDSFGSTDAFCKTYCGYHDYMTSVAKNRLTFGVVGNPTPCLGGCVALANKAVSPNNDVAIDGMISVVAHELTEAVTDPSLNAWYDSAGYENADKCAWAFGTVSTAPNGAKYNVAIGTRKYLVQQNWDPVRQGCFMG